MPEHPVAPDPDRLVGFAELHSLFPQLIRAALPDVTAEQLSAALHVYDDQLASLAQVPLDDAVFTIDQATMALRRTLDLLA